MLAADAAPNLISPEHNSAFPADVNGDSFITPADALTTIQHFVARSPTLSVRFPGMAHQAENTYPDFNDDGDVSIRDIVGVLHALRSDRSEVELRAYLSGDGPEQGWAEFE